MVHISMVPTEHCVHVVSTPALYFGGTRFKSQPRGELS
jgi:hypothetical protein